jgi:hypothetical protein
LFWWADGETLELREGKTNLVTIALKQFIVRILQQTGEGSNSMLSMDLMSLEVESDSAKIRLVFENIYGTRDPSGIQLTSGHGELLLKFK